MTISLSLCNRRTDILLGTPLWVKAHVGAKEGIAQGRVDAGPLAMDRQLDPAPAVVRAMATATIQTTQTDTFRRGGCNDHYLQWVI